MSHPSRFFVTGLPRSRTAWMAEFLTHGDSICCHEPILGLQTIEDINHVFDSQEAMYSGISDSGLGFWLGYILDELRVRTVIIERSIEEVEASIAALNLGIPKTNFCELLQDTLESYRYHPLVKWVTFESLNQIAVMRQIYWHLMPGAAFDEGRYEAMKNQIIECDKEKIWKDIERTKGNNIMREIMPYIEARS